jgi:peptide/nickel transport system substrate-binding protein
MKRSFSRLAAISCLLAFAANGPASLRPRYGGTVRVLLQHRVTSLDPAAEEDHPAARDRVAGLLFETLTSVDDQGRVHPRLASSWSADPSRRVWQFRLRVARFTDGSPLTAADVAASLSKAGTAWRSTASDRQTVSIESASPVLHMPEALALSKFAIVKRQPDGSLLGTGPFKLGEWQPGERAVLQVNDDYWGGRAYPDSIEFQMGASLREQLVQRQLNGYAAAEITVDQLRVLDQTVQNVALSRPADLLVIVFLQPDAASPSRPGRKAVDVRLRQALALSLNRTAISNVLLQKKGAPAAALLPQWLTGYEFLFPSGQEPERARKLAAEAALAAPAPSISLSYDFADPLAKMVAERIAVDAREIGIKVQPYGDAHVNQKSARASLNGDAVLLRIPLPSLEPSVALAALASDLGIDSETASAAVSATRLEDLYEIERKTLENFRVVPVARLSNAVWLNANTHEWQQLPHGAWDLDQLWVEGAR